MWEQLSAEQKQNYGEDYFERALRSLEKYTEKVMIKVLHICFSKTNWKLIYALLLLFSIGCRFGTNHSMPYRCSSTHLSIATLHSNFDQRKIAMFRCWSFATLHLWHFLLQMSSTTTTTTATNCSEFHWNISAQTNNKLQQKKNECHPI